MLETGRDNVQTKAANDDVAAGGGDMVLAVCPHVSPVSPRVPSFLTQVAADDDFERDALKKRAAIMEFDGGMTRADAEAAARALLGLAA